MTKYVYLVTVETATKDEADSVMVARLDHEEDLTEDGVGDYVIEWTYLPWDDPQDPIET